MAFTQIEYEAHGLIRAIRLTVEKNGAVLAQPLIGTGCLPQWLASTGYALR